MPFAQLDLQRANSRAAIQATTLVACSHVLVALHCRCKAYFKAHFVEDSLHVRDNWRAGGWRLSANTLGRPEVGFDADLVALWLDRDNFYQLLTFRERIVCPTLWQDVSKPELHH